MKSNKIEAFALCYDATLFSKGSDNRKLLSYMAKSLGYDNLMINRKTNEYELIFLKRNDAKYNSDWIKAVCGVAGKIKITTVKYDYK